MKINICFIISNLCQGGAERQFLELIKNINKEKFNVTVCLYAINKGIFYKEINNINEIVLIKNILKQKIKIFKIIEAILFIRKFLKKNRFDLIQTTLFMNSTLVRICADYFYNNKIIASIRKPFSEYPRIYKLIERRLLVKSFVVANSKKATIDFKKYCNNTFDNKIYYIGNGIDTQKFGNLHRSANQRDNKIHLGSVGSITYCKNHIQIIRVLKKLNQTVDLKIIGKKLDAYEELVITIKKLDLSSMVEIFESVETIQDYYKNIDIFILPSIYEGCPNVLFEAMLSKCFCVVSANANSDNYVVSNWNGLCYDGSDEGLKTALSSAIKKVKNNEHFKIINNGYTYAKNEFNIEKMVRSYETLYSNIISMKN